MPPAEKSRVHRLLLLSSRFLTSQGRAIHAKLMEWKLVVVGWGNSPVFYGRAFTALWSIVHFLWSCVLYGSRIIISIGVLKYNYGQVKGYLSTYLPGSWGVPYFPLYRSIFIYVLVTLPLWGLTMTAFTATWFAFTQMWACGQQWRHNRNYYRRGTELDLRSFNEDGEPQNSEFHRRADSWRPGKNPLRRLSIEDIRASGRPSLQEGCRDGECFAASGRLRYRRENIYCRHVS
ncbi:hypothetical protein B0H19DRAFT_696370 [Mycena capillaripes]|nr:hypothetical protein B0H19DRAFT_696370 [Mycena capillaripes]